MHEHDQHESPIKNWKQLVVVVVLAFAVPITVIVILSQFVTGTAVPPDEDEDAVLRRIKPVGDVRLALPSGPKGQLSGEQVYNQVCKTCHENGIAGAPKVGDKAAWSRIIAQGLATSLDHAVKGIRAMPPKGGNPDFENIEVERAIVYMANQAGANWKAPPVTAAAASTDRTGEEIVNLVCAKCHATGERGAPKIGDSAAWTPRVAKGLATVTQAALKGHGGMPARGGMADLSDVEVKRAVEYMFNSGIAKAAAPAPAAPAAAAPAVAAAAPATGKPDGKKVYDGTCVACHATGVAGAPKFGDKAAWAPRLKTGTEALYASALKGKAAMPAKGGNASLADADVKAAVDYMVAAAR
jgi:cytochrome c5